ncbi:F-actin-capping protein subunit alpha [Clonorchis sinensis]|uniref:F-actin-capping protein subunit alpha n=1 Tax=Clonorchis sinensis TaxID=79923 RepID=A0A8T1MK10_CLOSI|nr:F-actin-capping protein subunit alpha [Clonorchis sinensis]
MLSDYLNSKLVHLLLYIISCSKRGLLAFWKVFSNLASPYNCKKTGVVFDDLISALDIVNCQSVQVQSMGQLQTVNVDKTDGCQIYLSSQSLYADIITAKSSELNVLVPKANGDYDEFPVPEQFKTKFTGKGLQTTQMDSI